MVTPTDTDAPVTIPAVLFDMLTEAYSVVQYDAGPVIMFARHVDPWGNPTVREYRVDSIRLTDAGVRVVVRPVGGGVEDERLVDPSAFHDWGWAD